jgi:CheY-like chemotaxis protein/anti-sigma regulatory factor (Ser/Thr protein kinase)
VSNILVVDDDSATRRLLESVLTKAGFTVVAAVDGREGVDHLRSRSFDLVFLDVWMPHMNGLEVLELMRKEQITARVVVFTSDTTPETILHAVRQQAYRYMQKPVEPDKVLELARAVLAAPPALPIEVVSGRPDWIELLVPCTLNAAERVYSFMAHLDADLSDDVRDSISSVFREMLNNAIEWGGKLDPSRKVRISYIHAKRMLLYRIADPGPGFSFDELPHAAINNPDDQPIQHIFVRQQEGLRPGGFGILMSRQSVDELIYNEAQNEVVFIKYLD